MNLSSMRIDTRLPRGFGAMAWRLLRAMGGALSQWGVLNTASTDVADNGMLAINAAQVMTATSSDYRALAFQYMQT